MFRRFRELFWLLLSRLADAFQLLGYQGVTAVAGSFALPAWAAYTTGWLNAWGPIAWVGSGFLGVAVFACVALLWAAARKKTAEAKWLGALSQPPRHANPLQADFSDQRLSLIDFFNPLAPIHTGKTFRRCHIHGPGVMVLVNHCTMRNFGLRSCDLIEIGGGAIHSAVGFSHTTFADCEFFNIAILLTPDAVEGIRADLRQQGKPAPYILTARDNERRNEPQAGAPARQAQAVRQGA